MRLTKMYRTESKYQNGSPLQLPSRLNARDTGGKDHTETLPAS